MNVVADEHTIDTKCTLWLTFLAKYVELAVDAHQVIAFLNVYGDGSTIDAPDIAFSVHLSLQCVTVFNGTMANKARLNRVC